MTNISRKDFFKLSIAAIAVPTTVLGKVATQVKTRLNKLDDTPYFSHPGLQVYTLREKMAKDPIGTLERIAKIGYKELEFYDTRMLPMATQVKDLGMSIVSTHFMSGFISGVWDTTYFKSPPKENFESLLEQCTKYGIKNVGIGYLSKAERGTLDDYKKFADKANIAGEKAKKAGIQLYYHNHSFEFAPTQGSTPMAVLIERFDKELVKLELDVFWVSISGNSAVDWIKKLAGRVMFLHLKDMKKGTPVNETTEGVEPDSFTALGEGVLDFKSILTAAHHSKVPYTFVEQDHSSIDPFDSITNSLKYLQSIKL